MGDLNIDPVKAVQGATSDEIAQGTPVAPVHVPEVPPKEDIDTAETERKLRIIEGLSDAAIAIANNNPGAAAGLASAAASLAEDIPVATVGLHPKVAAGLAQS